MSVADSALGPMRVAPSRVRQRRRRAMIVRTLRVLLLIALLAVWHVLTDRDILPVYIFGRPIGVAHQLWSWFSTGYIVEHLITTLTETLLAFLIGTLLGLMFGLWLGLSDLAAQILLVGQDRLELSANGLRVRCSTN